MSSEGRCAISAEALPLQAQAEPLPLPLPAYEQPDEAHSVPVQAPPPVPDRGVRSPPAAPPEGRGSW